MILINWISYLKAQKKLLSGYMGQKYIQMALQYPLFSLAQGTKTSPSLQANSRNEVALLTKKLKMKNVLLTTTLVLILFLRMFVISPVTVSGVSMEPTLYSGERGILLKKAEVQRNDIICFMGDAESQEVFIKRVIGVEGDTIRVSGNHVYVNGVELEEDYLIDYPIHSNYNLLGDVGRDFTVPENTYFVLGDNRTISLDSREIGFVAEEAVAGKLIFSFGAKSH